MSDKSSIGWTDATWNPVTGCTEVSPGCEHCYAKTFSERWRGIPGHHFENGFDVTLRPERLGQPSRWKRPRRIFVNSMSDLFHKNVPDEFIEMVFLAMLAAPHHTFQLLTKRPERMSRFVRNFKRFFNRPTHVNLGVSVENSDYGWRVDMLRKCAGYAGLLFISAEPLLGSLAGVDISGVDWVIVGGESGHGARPMDLDWARDVRDRCVEMHIPFFFKQIGGFPKKQDGDDAVLDGRTWTEFP